jgi:hypothetical protein
MKIYGSIKTVLFTVMFVTLLGMLNSELFAQERPGEPAGKRPEYAFIAFDKSYNDIVRAARRGEYEVKEEETASRYGKYLVSLKKPLKFYSENLYLYFNENKELIFFTVIYELNENGSKRLIEKLVSSIGRKFEDEYGESERDTVPYFKIVENEYELFVKPVYVASTAATVSFKHLTGYDEYQQYYVVDVGREEDEEVKRTVENF